MGMNSQGEVATDILRALCSRFEEKGAEVGVIGLGYVGVPLALLFARGGFSTTGFDIDQEKVEKLEQLRALSLGHRIRVGVVPHAAIGVDTYEDYLQFVHAHRARPTRVAA